MRIFISFLVLFLPINLGLAEKIDKVVATIKDQTIRLIEVDREIANKPIYQKFIEENPKKIAELRKLVLDKIIRRRLLIKYGVDNNLINNKELNSNITEIENAYGGKDQLTELLVQTRTTYEEFIKQVSDDNRLNQVLNKALLPQVNISDSEIAKYLKANKDTIIEERRLSAIFIPVADAKDKGKVTQNLELVYSQIKEGKITFAEAVTNYSKDLSAKRGGDVGYLKFSSLPENIAKEVFSLNKDQISTVLNSAAGSYIFKVVDIRTPLQMAKIKLSHEKAEVLMEELLKKLWKENQVLTLL
jgi:parvulin-like peptidyl-prolyl isomerase